MNAAVGMAVDELPPLYRLALAYAPSRVRGKWLALLLLDARLSHVLRTVREPVLAQLRLAWWRDRLGEAAGKRPKGEPALALLDAFDGQERVLATLVDGWEAILTIDEGADAAAAEFCKGRADAGALIEQGAATDVAMRIWSLSDLCLHTGPSAAREGWLLELQDQLVPILPKTLRPLAILATIYRHAALGRGPGDLVSPRAWFTSLRIGLFGR